MLKHLITISLILVQLTVAAQMQEPCGTMHNHEILLQNDPAMAERMADIETFTQKWADKNPDVKELETIITIPVVVHVLYNTGVPATNISEAKILSQLAVLNADYRRLNWNASSTPEIFLPVAADAEIEFCLAQRDPDGFPTSGITRTATAKTSFTTSTNDAKSNAMGGKDAWPASEYLNMWVTPGINGGQVLGYAQFPGGDLSTDGVVIAYNCFGDIPPLMAPYSYGRTSVHEVGHWLNLRHIWGDGPCEQDDFVADTPRSDGANYGCPNTNSCSNETPDYNDMVQNYMDYSNDNCQSLLTLGQKQRMRALFEPGGFRYSLTQSNGCVPVLLGASDANLQAIVQPFSAGQCTVLEPVIQFQNFGTETLYYLEIFYTVDDGETYTYQWTGELASTASTTFTLPPVTINNGALLHTLQVVLANPNGVPDFNPDNDILTTTFTSIVPGTPIPFTESFVGSPFPFGIWSFVSTDDVFFSLNNSVGNLDNSSAFMTNYTYDAVGQIDEFKLPRLDFLDKSPVLEFWMAYAQQSETDIPDVLEVMVSADCGQTFTTVFIKGGAELATASGPVTESFVPNGNQWRKESIDLSGFSNLRNVVISFKQTRGTGNNLYVDDINIIGYVVGVDDPIKPDAQSARNAFTLFPNPATGTVSVQLLLNNAAQTPAKLVISDNTGRLLISQTVNTGNGNSEVLDISLLPAGIYFVTLTQGATTQTQKLLIMK